MSQLITLGAINKLTGEYVFPRIANKKDEYKCPECNKDLILCQGAIKAHHFRHKVDHINPCYHYTSPSESQIHKDAKLLMKNILEKKKSVSFIRKCISCKDLEEHVVPLVTDSSEIKLEYRFEYNGPKIADVAYIDSGDITCIIEICHTHKTCSENRPEPWFEIDARTFINSISNKQISHIEIPCIRLEKCEDCVLKDLKKIDLDKYVRIKLGQKYPVPDYYNQNPDNSDYRRIEHLRFDFHAGEDYQDNNDIISLFENDLRSNKYKIVVHSWKGSFWAYIINKEYYDSYNYYDIYNIDKYPYVQRMTLTGMGTVDIIKHLITHKLLKKR